MIRNELHFEPVNIQQFQVREWEKQTKKRHKNWNVSVETRLCGRASACSDLKKKNKETRFKGKKAKREIRIIDKLLEVKSVIRKHMLPPAAVSLALQRSADRG